MLPASIPPKPTHVGGPVLGFAGNELSVRRAQVGDVEQVQAGPPRPLMRQGSGTSKPEGVEPHAIKMDPLKAGDLA